MVRTGDPLGHAREVVVGVRPVQRVWVGTHHRFPLLLRHLDTPDAEWLGDGDLVLRLFYVGGVGVAVGQQLRPHPQLERILTSMVLRPLETPAKPAPEMANAAAATFARP